MALGLQYYQLLVIPNWMARRLQSQRVPMLLFHSVEHFDGLESQQVPMLILHSAEHFDFLHLVHLSPAVQQSQMFVSFIMAK